MRLPLPLLTVLLTGCIGFRSAGSGRVADVDPAAAAAAEAAAREASWRPRWQTIGKSVQDRPLRVTSFGRGPRRVLWVGGIHGDERVGRVTNEELPRAFVQTPGAVDRVTLTMLEDCNPDGTAGNTRGNARRVDLNRNYPAANFKASAVNGRHPLDQPEAKVLHDLIRDLRPHLVVVVHAWRGDHFINFDGPAEPLARRFSELSGYRVQPSNAFSPTPGSLGSWVGGTLGLPILTLEYPRGHDPRLAWEETRAAILAVVAGA
jgi:protein MpaA